MFLIYDITKKESFNNVEDWQKEVTMNTSDCMMFLVGNQVDNESQREVSTEEAAQYSKDNLMAHYGETSAKTGEAVEETFI